MISESQAVGSVIAQRTPAQAEDSHNRSDQHAWRRSEIPPAVSVEPATWIIFMDRLGLGKQVSLQLGGAAHRVIEVIPGKAFTRVGKSRYVIQPGNRADFERLIGDIRKRGNNPQKVMHLWSVDEEFPLAPEECLSLTFHSLLHLTEVVREQDLAPLNVAVISTRLQSVLGEAIHNPTRATVSAVNQIHCGQIRGLTCRHIDCDLGQGMDYVAVQLIAEQCSRSGDPVVAYRGEDRWVLRGTESRRLSEGTGPTHEKGDIEGLLASWWRELLSVDEVALDDDFFELGGHSLIGVSLFSKIKKTYGLDLGLATLFEARTVRELAQFIRQHSKPTETGASKPWSPLVPIQPRGKRRPLYVISGLGGNVVKFHALALRLGDDQPVFGLLPRGLDGKSPFHTRIEDIAADYVRAIRSKQTSGPYQLVGYSFGGIVAFEVAQQLIAQGQQVSLLGMFDTLEWHYGDNVDESLRPGERIDAIKEHLNEIFFGQDGREYLGKLVSAKMLNIKNRIFRAAGRQIVQEDISIEEINSFAGAAYRPKLYPGKLVLFRSAKRCVTDGDDSFLGWGKLAQNGVDVRDVPSTHFNMLQEPAVAVLAEELKTCLEC